MKVALILPANKWFCPYVNTYTNIFDKENIAYDVIFWNRDQTEPSINSYSSKSRNKILSYIGYLRFIKSKLKKNRYDRIVVFSSQLAILLFFSLIRLKGKYILDFRDLSIEQKPILYSLYKILLSHSLLNVLSSPGFKSYLPKKNSYVVVHNLDMNAVTNIGNKEDVGKKNEKNEISILTIGSIRDYDSNIAVVNALRNQEKFRVSFVGKGIASQRIAEYVKSNNIRNVDFKGFYKKKDEGNIIMQYDFLNVFYPNIKSHSSALSNRFYNALIYKKPLLVTSNSIQGDFVEKYNLGLSVSTCDNLASLLLEFYENFNRETFENNCNFLLQKFVQENSMFEKLLIKHLQ